MKNSKSQTKLKEHKLTGKKLIPPFASLEMTPSSWIDNRMPEMLWAVLLANRFPRKEILKRFSKVIDIACDVTNAQTADWRTKPLVVTLSGMTSLKDLDKQRIMQAIVQDDEAKQALVPMLFFDNLPDKKHWESILKLTPTSKDVYHLWGDLGLQDNLNSKSMRTVV